jgi:hypothetical protein
MANYKKKWGVKNFLCLKSYLGRNLGQKSEKYAKMYNGDTLFSNSSGLFRISALITVTDNNFATTKIFCGLRTLRGAEWPSG